MINDNFKRKAEKIFFFTYIHIVNQSGRYHALYEWAIGRFFLVSSFKARDNPTITDKKNPGLYSGVIVGFYLRIILDFTHAAKHRIKTINHNAQ